MIPRRQDDGKYIVAAEDGTAIAGPFETHSEAYRWIDRHEGDPINPSEKAFDYFLKQRGLA